MDHFLQACMTSLALYLACHCSWSVRVAQTEHADTYDVMQGWSASPVLDAPSISSTSLPKPSCWGRRSSANHPPLRPCPHPWSQTLNPLLSQERCLHLPLHLRVCLGGNPRGAQLGSKPPGCYSVLWRWSEEGQAHSSRVASNRLRPQIK